VSADGSGATRPGGPVIGIGTDLVDVDRLRTALGRTPGLADRLFTSAEQDAVAGRRDPAPGLAARFAAKEAVMKALGSGLADVGFTDIEVRTGDDGAPSLELHGRAAARAAALGVRRWHLSLTHTGGLAQAVALAEG
jgi:holo-[acyl-carrier protein] synthase